MNIIAEYARDIIETALLVLIFLDGRKILGVERATFALYQKYFEHRAEERKSKLTQLAAARAAKAAKKDAGEPSAKTE